MRTLSLPETGTPMVVSPTSLERKDSVDSTCSSRSSSSDRAISSSGSNQSARRESGEEMASKPARKWVRKEKIGQGAQGCVYRCLETATGREAACKVILLRDLSAMEVMAIKREVATIKKLKHPRLVRYWRATEVPHKRLSIYMEFAAGGALSGRLRREGPLPMELVKKFARQLCEALAFLHARGIAHRDIKCANVFLTSSGEDADIKLGDFGAFKETGSASLVGGLKGTPHWMAPEVIRGVPPPAADSTSGSGGDGESWWFRADVWSLGCATLEMLTGHAPWRQYSNPHTAMYQIVASNNTPTIPADASDETTTFLQRCLQREPMNRATIAELLMHPFLDGSEAMASTGNCSSTKSSSGTMGVDASDDDGRHGSAGSEGTRTGKTKKAPRNIEPESSPTVKSDDELSTAATNGVRRPAEDDQDRSRSPGSIDGDNHIEEELLQTRQQSEKQSDEQQAPKHDASPERLHPSRIPRLKPLGPLKKTKREPPVGASSSPTNNNTEDDGNQHLKQSNAPEKPTNWSDSGSSQLPRLVADKSSKKREFAIPKHSLMPTSSIALTGAAAPLKPAVLARRTVRAISPLPQRRVATAPPSESSSSTTNTMSPPGGGNGVTRLKLPPLTAARAVTASRCRREDQHQTHSTKHSPGPCS